MSAIAPEMRPAILSKASALPKLIKAKMMATVNVMTTELIGKGCPEITVVLWSQGEKGETAKQSQY